MSLTDFFVITLIGISFFNSLIINHKLSKLNMKLMMLAEDNDKWVEGCFEIMKKENDAMIKTNNALEKSNEVSSEILNVLREDLIRR